ncbi:MAG: 50S ribosomal protein L25, partial [Deltaproteobacteria bacterium]|nr:50S ribosomal protein L25 [Deltaproteobacteria bacterium]
PAIFYGQHTQAMMLAVKAAELRKIQRGGAENVFIRLLFNEDDKITEKLSMIKELQKNPLTGRPHHVDFYEISMDHSFTFVLPLHFSGVPVGVENGGDLQHLKREIKVSCLPTVLPDAIIVDIQGLDIGDSLKIGELVIPDGITILDHADVAVVAVSAKKEAKVAEAEEEEKEEETKAPERVVGEKKAKEEK